MELQLHEKKHRKRLNAKAAKGINKGENGVMKDIRIQLITHN